MVEHQQSIHPGLCKSTLLMLPEYHGQHRAFAACQDMRQAKHVAIVSTQPASRQVGHDGDVERRARHLMQRPLSLHTDRTPGRPALLAATAVNALEPLRADKPHAVDIFAQHAVVYKYAVQVGADGAVNKRGGHRAVYAAA